MRGIVRDPEELLRSTGCPEHVIRHSRAVRDCALGFCGVPEVDTDLVREGAMLHDIGRSETHGIGHAQAGAAICRSLSCPEEVVRIVERHIGAGLTADECALLRLAPRDCVPRSLEEKIVANADNLVRGDRVTSIYDLMIHAAPLPRKARARIFRLSMEMELFR
ncbi:MAG: HDIG domain-containing protein [Methanomicrobiaceae archaeon]|nr:HDIG domain-containing protein [Methanomicrobiaceae archaeon]